MGLLDDLPRGHPQQFLKDETPPRAQWMGLDDVVHRYRYDPEQGNKIILGEVAADIIGIDDNRHMLTVAGSRAGKGVSAIIPNLIFYQGSMLVIDPKGELANITARRRADGLGQKVIVLDPFHITKPHVADYRASFNPLAFLEPGGQTLVENAGLIADALVIASDKDSHWDDTAKNFLEGVILHVATAPYFEGKRHLNTVRGLIMEGTTQEVDGKTYSGMKGLEIQMRMNGEANGIVQYAAADLFEKPENECGSVLSTARRHTKFLDYQSIQSVVQSHDFDLTALKTWPAGMTIYLCLPATHMASCSRWFRLFVNLALEAMGRQQGKSATELQTVFLMDEFASSIGRLSVIQNAAGLMAGDPYHVKLWPILQDLGQLKSLYTDRWETFMGNAGVLQFFGNNDLTTLEWITKRCGKTTIKTKRKSAIAPDKSLKGETGLSESTELHDLITPDEAARFFDRDDPFKRQLLLIGGAERMIAERMEYFSDPVFEGLYDE